MRRYENGLRFGSNWREICASWFASYRRAMKFDDAPALQRRSKHIAGSRPVMGFIYDFGRTLKRMFSFEEHL